MDGTEGTAALVQRYVDAFNRGDAVSQAACFAERGVIVDGTPPHLWVGPSAASDWYRDILIEGEHLGAGEYFVTLGKPTHNVITGNSAYFVAPAEMTFKFKGQPMHQVGAAMTFGLTREAGQWRIAAWAWAKGRPA